MDEFAKKIIAIIATIFLAFIVISIRFFKLQVIDRSEILQKAQTIRTRVKFYPPKRGEIYTSEGVVVAGNTKSVDIIVYPLEIKGKIPEEIYEIIDNPEIIEELNKRVLYYPIPIKTDVSYDELAETLPIFPSIPFMQIETITKRFYPLGEFASHIIGYVKLENIYEYIGVKGVEKIYDDVLKGEPSKKIVEINALGKEVEVVKEEEGEKGKPIWLTIRYELQKSAEELLKDKEGAIVVMNPYNGEILALASSPQFDPNVFGRKVEKQRWIEYLVDPRRPLINRAIAGEYHPGSTFKLVVAIAGLEEKAITPDFKVTCRGKFYFGKYEHRCWKKEGHGTVDLFNAIVKSCDVFFYTLGLKLGVDKIEKWAKKFGLGRKTGIDLDFEQEGLIPSREWKQKVLKDKWYDGENISLAIGQGYTTVTAVQMARFVSAIVNGGYLVTPHVVKKVDKSELEFPKEKIDVSEETLKFIKDTMLGVVEYGTASAHKIQGVKYGGKTGTAQVASFRALEKILGKPADKIKDEEIPKQFRDHAWFVAYFPYENPEIVMSVVVEHCGAGSKCAAPIAKKIIEKYIQMKNQEGIPQKVEIPHKIKTIITE